MRLKALVKEKKYFFLVMLALVPAVFVIWPLIGSGYFWDDSLTSMIRGTLSADNQTISNYTLGKIDTAFSQGRFFPGAAVGYFIFFLIEDLALYKFSILLLTILNLALFGYFVKMITGSRSLAALTIMIAPLMFQFRLYHDAILSYSLLLQLVFLYLLTSFILLLKYLKTGKKIFFAFSMLAFILSLLTYEVSYPFFILHYFLIYYYANKQRAEALTISMPYAIPAVAALVISVLLRSTSAATAGFMAQSYAINPDLKAYIATLIKQLTAALPLNYYILDPHKIFSVFSSTVQSNILALALLFASYITISVLVLTLVANKNGRLNFEQHGKKLLLVGLLLLVLPGLTIAALPKYQSELVAGVGYLPVYISYHGMALIGAYALSLLINKLKAINKSVLPIIAISVASLIIATAGVVNMNNNQLVVERLNTFWFYPRTFLADAVQRGLLDDIDNGSNIFVDTNASWADSRSQGVDLATSWWRVPGFYRMNGGPAFREIGTQPDNILQYITSENSYYLRFDASSKNEGYAFLAKINREPVESAVPIGYSEKIYFYYLEAGAEYPHVNGMAIDKARLNVAVPFSVKTKDLRPASSGADWKIFTIKVRGRLIDLQSIYIK